MKLVRIDRMGTPCWGVVEDDNVFTLKSAPYGKLEYDGDSVPLCECRLLPPCEPTKIVCVGKNYVEHAREMGAEPPGFPVLFIKAPNTLNSHNGSVHAPDFVSKLDYEGELAFVISRKAKDVKEKDFSDYVLGYTCLNDVTARDIQRHDGQWTRGKSMDGFCPVGPCLITDIDPSALDIQTKLNGKVVQQGNTADFITPVGKLIEFITASMTLEPGDVVATGTPAGVGAMAPGDIIEVEIEGIGILKNHII